MADEYSLSFLETSAMNNINVDDAFLSLARAVKKRIIDTQEGVSSEKGGSMKLEGGAINKLKSSCCYGGGSSKQSK